MLLASLLFLVCLHLGESLVEVPGNISNNNLIATTQKVICLTESNVIHMIISGTDDGDDVNQLIAYLNKDCGSKSVIISKINESAQLSFQQRTSLTVFVVNATDFVDNFLESLRKNGGKNNKNKFLFVLPDDDDITVAENIFERFISHRFFNVAVLMTNQSNVSILTRDPFLGRSLPMRGSINVVSQIESDIFLNRRSNLRGRSVVVLMYEQHDRALPKRNGELGYTGVDGWLAELVEERLNASFVYIKPQEMYNGYQNSGVLGELIPGVADISFNAEALFMVNGTVETTESFDRNDICILIPRAGKAPLLYNLLLILSKTSWLVILLSIIVMVLIYRWTQNIQKVVHSTRNLFYEYSWLEISTIIFQSFFGDSITKIPTSIPLRMLVLGWCIYSFIVTNAFTAKLIGSLVTPRYLVEVKSIEELGHSNLKILIPRALANHLNANVENRTMSIIQDQLEEANSWKEFEASIGNKSLGGIAYVMMRSYAEFTARKHFDKSTRRPLYKVMDECLLSLPRVYFLQSDSVYVDYVNELLRRFHEMGFILKWTRNSELLNTLSGDYQSEDDEEDEEDESKLKVVMTINHLQTCFYLLFFGLVIATLGFIVELIHYRRSEITRTRIEKS